MTTETLGYGTPTDPHGWLWLSRIRTATTSGGGDVSALVAGAPDALNTLAEIDAQIAADEGAAAALAALVAGKAPLASPALTGSPTINGAPVARTADVAAAAAAQAAATRAVRREVITRRPIRVAPVIPTITLGAANAATAISGSTLRAPLAGTGTGATQVVDTAADPSFRYLGSPTMLYNFGSIKAQPLVGTTSNLHYAFSTVSNVYCDQLEIEFTAANTFWAYRLRINDEWVTKRAVQLTGLTVGARYRILVSFGSVAARKVQLDMADNGFNGLRLAPVHSVRRFEQVVGTPTVFVGDSITKQANLGSAAGYSSVDSWAAYFAEQLGWRDVRNGAMPGTGFVNAGTEAALTARLADIAVPGARVVVYAGLNDVASVATTLPAAVDTVFAAIVAAGPAELIVLGCHPANSSTYTNTAYQQVNSLLAAKAAQYGATFLDPFTVRWVDASNVAVFVNPDNIHPTGDGAEWLGTAYADEYARLTLSA